MSMIVKHRRLASMSIQSEDIRKIAATVCDNVVLDADDGQTTAVTHHPDGRIEIHCHGDTVAFTDAINQAGGLPNSVEAVQS